MSEMEIIKDKIMFICIVFCGRNNISKKGVVIMEKLKFVFVCRIEVINIIYMKMNVIFKIVFLFN